MKPDQIDCAIINHLQGGFPLSDQPYLETATALGLQEQELIERLERLNDAGVLSRFGPMYNAEALGGAVTLCALSAPEDRFDAVSTMVNAHQTVAHNYAREHELNMWFVIASETAEEITATISAIEAETQLPVYNFPKQQEFYIGLKVIL